MKYSLLLILTMINISNSFAGEAPARRSLSDINYSTYKSSEVTGSLTDRQNVLLSTGVLRLDYVWISSPGVNSRLVILDASPFGQTTTYIAGPIGDNTNSTVEIPYRVETSSHGIIFTSTCTACTGSAWSPPRFRFGFERIR